ncbi:uncharacterized protein V6R79_010568 [Siganus canaliculatus]
MAERGSELDRDAFLCLICLELLKDPVTIPCGHSYCSRCIQDIWDQEYGRKIPSCPHCQQRFIMRPVLGKNKILSALVDQLKKSGLQDDPDDDDYAGAEDVACDFCSGRKLKALKSCLQCLASYCEEHLQPHYDVPPLRKHKLVEPSTRLQENVCSRHNEAMKMFCRSDQKIICYLCTVDEHKGHNMVSAAAERTNRQVLLEWRRQNIQKNIEEREKDVELLQQEVVDISRSADQTVEDSQEIFTQLIRVMEQRRYDVEQQVRSQQEAEVSRVKELEEKLEQEIRDLRRRDAELKKVSDTEDHSHFLQDYLSLSGLSGSTYYSRIKVRPVRHFEDVTTAVSKLRDQLQELLSETWTSVSLAVTEVDGFLSGPEPEPKTRSEFLKYACDIRLDPNTAHTQLLLSEENRKVTCEKEKQPYPPHPDRFTVYHQVLSQQGLAARCYWEVEWREGVSMGVTYKSISREGWFSDCLFGKNDKSWALEGCKSSYTFWSNNIQTYVSGPQPLRIGVYLDYSAGLLSFYSVSGTMTLLHEVQTTFTEPVHAIVRLLGSGAAAEFCKLK